MSEKWSQKRSPADTACLLSRLFFCWMAKIYIGGYKKQIGTEDLYKNRNCDSADRLGSRLEKEWEKELSKMKAGSKPSLVKAAIRTFGFRYMCYGCLAVIGECISRSFQAVFLGYVVRYYSKETFNSTCETSWRMPNMFDTSTYEISETQHYIAAGGVCLAVFCYVLTYHRYFYGMQETGMRLRVACSTVVFKKALKLSRSAMGETTVGQMVNLLSNDVNKFDEALLFIPYLVVGPIQAVVSGIILWQYLGISCLAGISLLVLYIPLQGVMAKLFSKLRSKTTILTDERIRLMNETVSGMRVIKMYTWEQPFIDLIANIRKREIKKIRMTAILRGLNISLFFVASKLILLLAFMTFTFNVDCPLSSEAAFVSMTIFNYLRITMTLWFAYAVAQGSEGLISFMRLQRFLLLDEQDASKNIDASNIQPKPDQCGVWLTNVTGKWNKEVHEPNLKNISAVVRPGELLAVVGSVGSGKSTLLMSVLGELPLSGGTVKVRGKVAYASQEPWVFAGDVRSNVLFGQEFDEKKYQKVLHVCALDKDIEQLPYGDRTLVGERGVSLSGGQKARVNLARALYFDADIYLLDDPLSAVDAAVSKHLFEKCINGYLKSKTRILVTHQVQFLRAASQIMVLKDGNCLAYGNYMELTRSGVDIVSMLELARESRLQRQESTMSNASSTSGSSSRFVQGSSLSLVSDDLDPDEFIAEGKPYDENAPREQEETKSSGSIDSAVYGKYIRAGAGPLFLIVFVFANLLSQAVFNGSDFWLSTWTDTMSKSVADSGNCSRLGGGTFFENIGECRNTEFFVIVYAGFCGVLFVVSFLRSLMFFILCMKSSEVLHNRMFTSVVRAPMSFFDSNPMGRILNRFTKDMGTIDDLIPLCALDVSAIFLGLVGALIVAGVINYYLAIPAVVLVAVFFVIRRFYLVTARDLKRIEGITRSPVFSHITTSLYGLTTLRAFKAQGMFEDKFYLHQDRHTTTWYNIICGTTGLGYLLDLICVVYISVLTAVLILVPQDDNSGNVGLAISSALMLCGSFQWGLRQSAEIENQMTAVERVVEYSTLTPEANLESSPDKKPPGDWPLQGGIVFNDMSLTYLPKDPPVLKNLKCTIQPMEKVGIVGRTGAGKSSIISALFRMTEPDGQVLIDGIDSKSIGLHDLRSKISIIPQDPVLFTGPVRRNIDPFNKHDDTSLWKVLEEVQLKDAVTVLPGGLDTFLSEGGSNFSVGQRQLICMARAILRNNRILVLDEATANVDARTDALIQRTIREKFNQCTVLTIAHRLNTIMDSDRVLVLDAGRIQEFHEPYILLQDEHGLFYDMVLKTGPAMKEQLFKIAKKSSEAKRGKLAPHRSSSKAKSGINFDNADRLGKRLLSEGRTVNPTTSEQRESCVVNEDAKPYRTDSDTGEVVPVNKGRPVEGASECSAIENDSITNTTMHALQNDPNVIGNDDVDTSVMNTTSTTTLEEIGTPINAEDDEEHITYRKPKPSSVQTTEL